MRGLSAELQQATITGLFGALRDNFVSSRYFKEVTEKAQKVPYLVLEDKGRNADWKLQFTAYGGSGYHFSWTVTFKDKALGKWHYASSSLHETSGLHFWYGKGPTCKMQKVDDELFIKVCEALQKTILQYIRRHRLSLGELHTAALRPTK